MDLTRRDFLKLSGLSLAALAAGRLPAAVQSAGLLGRVTYDSSVFTQPRINLSSLRTLFRDELVQIEYALQPLTGPAYNPNWFKIADGYVHSSFVQIVEEINNTPVSTVPAEGILCRISVPISQPYTYSRQGGWQVQSQFLLYFDSMHWVTAKVDGPDGALWYQITESWTSVQYYAKAEHLEPISAHDLAPISPEVPAGQKRVEVSLLAQQLTAYESGVVKLRVPISSGVRNTSGTGLPTQTPTGTFNLYAKMPSQYMGDNRLTDTLGDRYLPGVPWACFFAEGGYALHGTYWHNNFGAPMSKGCINMRPEHAAWLYRWVTPVSEPDQRQANGRGTQVVIY